MDNKCVHVLSASFFMCISFYFEPSCMSPRRWEASSENWCHALRGQVLPMFTITTALVRMSLAGMTTLCVMLRSLLGL